MKEIDIILHKDLSLSRNTNPSKKNLKRLISSLWLNKLGSYNSLTDKNLANYFARPHLKSHLLRMKLIKKVKKKLNRSCIYRITDEVKGEYIKLPRLVTLPTKPCVPIYGLDYKKVYKKSIDFLHYPIFPETIRNKYDNNKRKVRSYIKEYIKGRSNTFKLPEISLNCIKKSTNLERSSISLKNSIPPIRNIDLTKTISIDNTVEDNCRLRRNEGVKDKLSALELQNVMNRYKQKSIYNSNLFIKDIPC